jgi:hypothetical protein
VTLWHGHLTPVPLERCGANGHPSRCSVLEGGGPAGESACPTIDRSRDARLLGKRVACRIVYRGAKLFLRIIAA